MDFDRITVEPDKLEGKPSVRGLRITVETVVRLVAAGRTFDEILAEHPDLESEDIRQALEYTGGSLIGDERVALSSARSRSSQRRGSRG